jgi:hypothetical protein
MQQFIENGKLKLQRYSLTELGVIYNVCARTVKKWLRPFREDIGIKNGRFYTINQVKVIVTKVGLPDELELDESLI